MKMIGVMTIPVVAMMMTGETTTRAVVTIPVAATPMVVTPTAIPKGVASYPRRLQKPQSTQSESSSLPMPSW